MSKRPELTNAEADVLSQCDKDAVWDGDIVSKVARDVLFKRGYIWHSDGYSYITETGRMVLRMHQRSHNSTL